MHFSPTHLLLTAVLGLLPWAASAQSVALSGVSGSKALLVIDGAPPRFVSAGQTVQGVKLLHLQGEAATVEVNGKRQTLQVGDAPVSIGRSGPAEGGGQRIVLTADARGHFLPSGQINGRAVQFMVDTGATSVAMSESDARRINLAYETGQRVMVSTANGAAVAHRVRLDSVRIGDVTVHGVEALVTQQSMPYVLLGNSFLNRFQMQRQNDQLTLDKRF
jgi:aspartyl protease family protein